jgi:hypothetical protein
MSGHSHIPCILARLPHFEGQPRSSPPSPSNMQPSQRCIFSTSTAYSDLLLDERSSPHPLLANSPCYLPRGQLTTRQELRRASLFLPTALTGLSVSQEVVHHRLLLSYPSCCGRDCRCDEPGISTPGSCLLLCFILPLSPKNGSIPKYPQPPELHLSISHRG